MLDVSPVRAFADNYVWLIHSPLERRRVVAVDPGDARPVEEYLRQHGLELHAVFVTHHHPDHVGGVEALTAGRELPVYGPRTTPLPQGALRVGDGDAVVLEALGLRFEVSAVPGHTLDHHAYAGHGALFCGDTLFSAGCGRLFEGTAAQMHDSLSRLAGLPADTRVYCAHEYTLANLRFAATVEPGNEQLLDSLERTHRLRAEDGISLPSTIGHERAVNPFLRCDRPAVRAAAERRAGRSLGSPAAVFAVLRAWKDEFR